MICPHCHLAHPKTNITDSLKKVIIEPATAERVYTHPKCASFVDGENRIITQKKGCTEVVLVNFFNSLYDLYKNAMNRSV